MADIEDSTTRGAIRETEHLWIPMPDGTRLAARVWWPASEGPFPALLEYIPYRKRDMVRARDERNHPYFAEHGYVCLRVDMRGSGDSEGTMPDMYDETELSDARHVISWIAAQPWSSGAVGMFGTSWGGTASLQAAVDAPGPLKAVLANCATADRFEDDIHWMGGCLLTDGFEWGATLPTILAAPPDSATVGEEWRRIWQARLDELAFPLDAWIQNRSRRPYWSHGSVRFDADRLTCPVLTIGGWADRYSNSVMRLVEARPDLCWGIVGPWGHHYPDQGEPGPAIGFQDLALQWWDRWLKGSNNAVDDWPPLRLWRREFDPPQDRLSRRSGDWIEIADLGAPESYRLHLQPDGQLADVAGAGVTLTVPSDLRHGMCAGDTGYFGRVGGLPLDQAQDDARALCFDSPPLVSDVDVTGHVTISVAVKRHLPRAQLAIRLCDVAPDGRSNLVTRHVANLALDEELDGPRPFSPEEPIQYRLTLPSTAYRFAIGHRIRLAIATSYWPLVWPDLPQSPVEIVTGESTLDLPVRAKARALSHPFPPVRRLPEHPTWHAESAGELVRRTDSSAGDCAKMTWAQPHVSQHFRQTATTFTYRSKADYTVRTDPNATVECTMEHAQIIRRPDGTADLKSRVSSEMTETGLKVDAHLTVLWNGDPVMTREWGFAYAADDEAPAPSLLPRLGDPRPG